jgi:hypothetical protein
MEKIFGSFRQAGELKAPRGEFLTEEEMRHRLPAIFADSEHYSRSDRYTYVSTMDLLRALAAEGYRPTFATQQATRREDMRTHTKHLLRLQRTDIDISKPEVPEIVMLNSHGGQSSVMLAGGLWRFVCMNGHVVGDTVGKIHVQHKGDIASDVIDGVLSITKRLEHVGDTVEAWKHTSLSGEEKHLLAASAATLRFDLEPGEKSPVSLDQILQPRRQADKADDLWTVYNRIQENVNKGGLYGLTRDKNNRLRNTTTRPIKGIDQNLRLNQALWDLADGMSKLKAGKVSSLPNVIDAQFTEVQ